MVKLIRQGLRQGIRARRGLSGLALVVLFAVPAIQAAPANPTNEQNNQNNQDVLRVVVPPLEKSAQQHMYYFPALIKLALSKTEATDGPFEIHEYPQVLTSGRLFLKLRRGVGVNVMWGPAKAEDDDRLLRIPLSLLRGLNSYRVFLIREEDQDKFAAIDSLDQLKQLRAGMVAHWPDTRILQQHGFSLVTPAHYELLFTMLEGGRLDYLPRGLYEVWEEHKANADRGFVIEQTLMLYYPGDMYFFVNSKDQALADRIQRGLAIAMEDGSFDELFFSIPGFKRGYEEMGTDQRQIFYLEPPRKHR